jgi:hypothetical protein
MAFIPIASAPSTLSGWSSTNSWRSAGTPVTSTACS